MPNAPGNSTTVAIISSTGVSPTTANYAVAVPAEYRPTLAFQLPFLSYNSAAGEQPGKIKVGNEGFLTIFYTTAQAAWPNATGNGWRDETCITYLKN